MRILLTFGLFFIVAVCAAQKEQRVPVEGEVAVPAGFDPKGIHIYNKSARLGTTSDEEGGFRLKMREGDTLFFSAVQFENLEVVVDATSFETRRFNVTILEGLNNLPEIVIRPHNLSGNLSEDLNIIEVVELPAIPPIPPPVGPPTGSSSERNAAMNDIGGGANHLKLLVKAVKFLMPKRKKKEPKSVLNFVERVSVTREIRSIIDDAVFTDSWGISAEEINAFLDFSVPKDFDKDLLAEKKRLDLLQYLMIKSVEYKEQP